MAVGDSITAFGQSLANRGKRLAVDAANQAIGQVRNTARNAVDNAINQGLSYVPAPWRGIARGAINGAIGGLGASGSMYSEPEDFKKLRQINKKLVQTEFVHEWDFRLEIDGQPADFDLYVKDLSYSGFEIGTDEENCGIATYTWPKVDQPHRISFTARDNYDMRVAAFIHEWADMVTGKNGTVYLPFGKDGYVKNIKVYNIKSSGAEILLYEQYGYPIQYGECTRSHENCAFMEMPVTLVAFSTIPI